MTDPKPVQKPKDWLEKAIQLHESGHFDEAKSLYHKVLQAHPHHAGTRHMLGLAEHQSGQHNAAIEQLKKAAAAEPRNAIYAGNLGVAYKAKGDLERAITAYKKALGIDPSIAALHNNLGVALQENGDHHGASASFAKALALNTRYPEAETNLGISQMRLDEPDKAIAHFRRAISLNPNYAAAHTQLGLAYIAGNRDSAAIDSLTKSLLLAPDPAIFTHLGLTQFKLENFDEAIAAFSQALALRPNDPDILCNLARSEAERRHLDQAEELYRAAIGSGDKRASTYFALAGVLRAVGKHHEAVQNYRWAIKANPDFAVAHRMIAFSKKFTEETDDITAIRRAHARAEPGSPASMNLGFALGKVEEDLGHYAEAFTHIADANRLHRQSISYDAYQSRHWAEATINLFSADLFARNASAGLTDSGPLFILGMPRSGTSLIEQILATHPAIYGAGEMRLITEIMEDAGLTDPELMFSDKIATLNPDRFTDLGRTYLSRTKHLNPAANFITNKMPGNFWRVGIIKLMLPNARIIHCRRNPLDNCLSIFKNFFAVGGLNYAYDLGELGTYHRLYQRLMDHWHKVLPGQIYDLDYEALTADQEGESKKLIDWLGLPWDPALLDFYKTDRAVQTASAVQVRQPIYASSVNLAERYGEALRPLIEALQDAG